MSSAHPGGLVFYYGLYDERDHQIGFLSFCNYIPIRKNSLPIMHGSRIVISPDFCGFGLAIRFLNESAKHLASVYKCEIRTTSSSYPMYKTQLKSPHWEFIKKDVMLGKQLSGFMRINAHDKLGYARLKKRDSFRGNTTVYKFRYKG